MSGAAPDDLPHPAPEGPPPTPPGAVPTVAWRAVEGGTALPGAVDLLDQTRLPHEQVALRCGDVATLRDAIRRLVVRGAPAIGVAGAYGTVLAAQDAARRAAERVGAPAVRADGTLGDAYDAAFRDELGRLAGQIRDARPTAVNLAWAVDRCLRTVAGMRHAQPVLVRLFAEAVAIHREDEQACAAMGAHGARLLREGGTYLTHCNTGRLAAAGIGTAFGVFVTGAARGLRPTVFVGEVRPLLQGARLTAFEMRERGIDGHLLPDSAAGSLLRSGRIEAVFVGADRIARNGDTANKVGTYPIAEVARANGVPFYVVAPTSTIDPALPDGSSIVVEERAPDEVTHFAGTRVAPEGVPVHNPAFDVTPARLVSGIVTERGIARPPYRDSLSF